MTTVAVVSSVRAKEASEIKSDNVFIAFRGKATSLKDANRAATNYLIENDADFKPEKLSVSVWLKPSSKTEHVEFSYYSDFGKMAWIVYFSDEGKIVRHQRGIKSEGP